VKDQTSISLSIFPTVIDMFTFLKRNCSTDVYLQLHTARQNSPEQYLI